MKGLIRFDKTPCYNFKIDRDLTPEAWARFAKRARIPDEMDPIVAEVPNYEKWQNWQIEACINGDTKNGYRARHDIRRRQREPDVIRNR